jgi:predicted dehydrogenase
MNPNVTSESRKLSCVVVGTGSIGKRHLQVLRSCGKIKVFAYPARTKPLLDAQSNKNDIIESWKQVQDLGITHAIIATNTGRHTADIQSAMDAGCNILVEKPMGVDAASAFSKWQEAIRVKRNLWVGSCLRFQQALNIFRDQLPHLGKIFSVRIECQSYLPDWRPQRPYKDSYSAHTDEGGVLRDLIHEIDYAGWLYGWPASVTAKIRTTGILDIAAEDTADILWENQKDVIVSMTLDYLTRPARRQMRAFGEFGMLEWDGIHGSVLLSLNGEQPHQFNSSQTRDQMYLEQDLAFIDATSSNGAFNERLASGGDGVRALAICDASREASKNKCEMRVRYPEGL